MVHVWCTHPCRDPVTFTEINVKVYVLGLSQNPSSQKKKMQMMHAAAVHAQRLPVVTLRLPWLLSLLILMPYVHISTALALYIQDNYLSCL